MQLQVKCLICDRSAVAAWEELVVCCIRAYVTIKRNYVVKFWTNGVLFAEVVGDLFCDLDCDTRGVPHTLCR